jgi:hypothetical protein
MWILYPLQDQQKRQRIQPSDKVFQIPVVSLGPLPHLGNDALVTHLSNPGIEYPRLASFDTDPLPPGQCHHGIEALVGTILADM